MILTKRMHKLLSVSLYVAVLFFGCIQFGLCAKDNDSDKCKLIEKTLEITGFKKQIEQFEDIINSVAAQHQRGLENSTLHYQYMKLVKDACKADKMLPVIVSIFEERFNEEYLTETLTWSKSPLGMKMRMLEVEACTPEAAKHMRILASKIQQLPQGRLALFEKFDAAIKETDLTVNLYTTCIYEMLIALQSAFLSPTKQLSEEQLQFIIDTVKTQLKNQFHNFALASLYYTYRSLSNQELKEAIVFYESDAGRWWINTSHKALIKAIATATREVQTKFAIILKEESLRKKPPSTK